MKSNILQKYGTTHLCTGK